jgi:predicted ATPase/DNA-binding XRE family transcriptional regulator
MNKRWRLRSRYRTFARMADGNSDENETFGALLRRLRLAAGLSQEGLAEAAQISAVTISAYERETRRAPYRDSAVLLAHALQLTGYERDAFLRIAGKRTRRATNRERASISTGNVIVPHSSFVGRNQEITAVEEAVRNSPVVTLTGGPGIGKSRLAGELAVRRLPQYESWVIDVGSLDRHTRLEDRIAPLLGLSATTDLASVSMWNDALKRRRVLLMLDGCENDLDRVGTFAQTVASSCSSIRILCTSRERLHLRSELVYHISGLPNDPSRQLFTDRLADAGRTSDHLREPSMIVDVCRLLDGIPLALELAAASAAFHGIASIEKALREGSLSPLAGGPLDAPQRQRSMDETLDWSYERLDSAEQKLLRRSSLFQMPFTLAAATALCSDDDLRAETVANVLIRLIDKSLLFVIGDADAARYDMVGTTRSYAAAKLTAASENAAFRRRYSLIQEQPS